eukprot:3518489-Rhodomonas_salina.3
MLLEELVVGHLGAQQPARKRVRQLRALLHHVPHLSRAPVRQPSQGENELKKGGGAGEQARI